MSESQRVCSICGAEVKDESGGLFVNVECDFCGEYQIHDVLHNKPELFKDDSHFMMCAVRHLSERGKEVRIDQNSPAALRALVIPLNNPLEMIDAILIFIADMADTEGYIPGKGWCFILPYDYPLFFCRRQEQLTYCLDGAIEIGLLMPTLNQAVKHQGVTKSLVCPARGVDITLLGWQRVEELRRRPDSKQAFVAMSFKDELREAWKKGIEPALRETGYDPLRIDNKEHNRKICDEIIAEIRRSGLLIADFTGHRGGVYFEAGYAMGLGITVIWTCREDDLKNAHFDTRQYNHIDWKTPEDLRERLVNRIGAIRPL